MRHPILLISRHKSTSVEVPSCHVTKRSPGKHSRPLFKCFNCDANMSENNIAINKRRMSEIKLGSVRSMAPDDPDLNQITIRSNSVFSQHDVHLVSQSVSHMNPFLARRVNEKQQLVVMREVLASGEITSLEISLRQLLGCVNHVADSIDAKATDGLELKSFGSSSTYSLNKLNVSEKSEKTDKLSATMNLRVRDLRRLDFHFNPIEEPSIWVRKHAVMFSVDPIRAIIMGTRIVIVVPPGGMDQILDILERYMRGTTMTITLRGSYSEIATGHI